MSPDRPAIKSSWAIVAGMIILAGCSSLHMPDMSSIMHPFGGSATVAATPVRALKNASDWSEAAHDVAFSIMQKSSQDSAMGGKYIRVVPAKPSTQFGDAYASALGSSLSSLGMKVTEDLQAPLTVMLDEQVVPSSGEMIVTTSVMENKRIVFSDSEVYNFDRKMIALYMVIEPPPKPEPTPVKEYKLTGGR